MVQEIITLHVGQTGCQVGKEYWDVICREHFIDSDGNMGPEADPKDGSHQHVTYFFAVADFTKHSAKKNIAPWNWYVCLCGCVSVCECRECERM